MSGAGFSPLLAYDPQDYVKWQQLQRRQALAQALLEKGMGETSNRPYSGLVQAGNSLLGAYLLKKSDADTAAMFGGGDQGTGGPGPSPDPGQISNMPTPPVKSADAASGPPQAAPPSPNQGMAPPTPMQSPAPPQMPQGQGAPPVNPHIAAIYNNPTFPKIPGVDPGTAVMAMMQGGQAWSDYMKAYYAAVGPTEAWRNAMTASGGDEKMARYWLGGGLTKGMYENIRQGGGTVMPGHPETFMGIPGPDGTTPVYDAKSGNIVRRLDPASAAAVNAAAYQQKLASAYGTAQPVFNSQTGQWEFGTQGMQTGQAPPPGVPGGPQVPGAPPTLGGPAQPARDLSHLAPEPAPGVEDLAKKVGGDAGGMVTRTQTAGNDANQQMNVIQNVYDMSRHGAQTGNLAETYAALDNYAASLGFKGSGNTSTKYDEIVKFMAQNTLRNWEASGGTGTNLQLENFARGTVHPEMLPHAVQDIARWNMAIINLNQAKANAQVAWFANGAHPQTAANVYGFENQWAQNADPRLFQYRMMNPNEKKAFAASLTHTQAIALAQKRANLRKMGIDMSDVP